MGAEFKIAEALEPVVQAKGLEIWDVERSGNSLRVSVDRPGGVDLDALADLSAAISELLDRREDLAPTGHYELDVSSPGLERRLRYPQHFARSVGREVALKTSLEVNGARRFEGVLVSASPTQVEIRGTSDRGEAASFSVPMDAIERAHTVFRWGPPTSGSVPRRSGRGRSAAAGRPASQNPGAAAPEEAE